MWRAAMTAAMVVAAPALGQARKASTSGPSGWHKPLITRAPDRLPEATDSPEPRAIHADPEPQRMAPPVLPRKAPEPWRPPLSAKPGTPLWADSVREATEFQAAARIKAYDSIGARNPRLDEQVRAVLAQAGARRADPSATDEPDLLDATRHLIVQGSGDPQVKACFASALAASNGPAAALPALEEAAAAMRHSRYGAYLKAEALGECAAACAATGARDKALPLFREAADQYFIAITGSGEPRLPAQHALSLLSPRIEDQFPPEVTRSLCDRLRDAKADPWLVSMLWGRYYERLAWDAVGHSGGPASSAGAMAFKQNQTRARDWYEDAYRINPGYPAPAADMIAIVRLGLARPGQDLKYWFDRAVEAQFDYPPTFTNTLAALRPRSGGDYAAMLGFGISCAQSERYDTIVPFQLVQAALDICDDMGDYRRPWEFPKVYDIAKQVLTRYVRSNPEHAAYYRALLAAIAWRAGEYEDAQLLVDALGPRPDLEVVRAVHALPRDMIEDLNTHTGPAAEIYRKADEAAAKGDHAEVRALYEQAVEVCKSSPAPLATAAVGKLASAKFQEAFQSGQWTDVPFEPGLPLWEVASGVWKPVSDSAIRIDPAGVRPVLVLREPVGMRVEVHGEIAFAGVTETSSISAGMGLGYDFFDSSDTGWSSIAVFPGPKLVGLSMGWPTAGDHPAPPANGVYTFDAICYDGIVRLTINGQAAYSGPMTIAAGWNPGDRLVLGARITGPTGPITLSNIRVRKLLEDPTPTTPQRTAKARR